MNSKYDYLRYPTELYSIKPKSIDNEIKLTMPSKSIPKGSIFENCFIMSSIPHKKGRKYKSFVSLQCKKIKCSIATIFKY